MGLVRAQPARLVVHRLHAALPTRRATADAGEHVGRIVARSEQQPQPQALDRVPAASGHPHQRTGRIEVAQIRLGHLDHLGWVEAGHQGRRQ